MTLGGNSSPNGTCRGDATRSVGARRVSDSGSAPDGRLPALTAQQ